MIGDVLQFRDLQELCRPGKRPRLATVERWAKQRKIRVQYDGQGGVWTTTAALNEALASPARPPRLSRTRATRLR